MMRKSYALFKGKIKEIYMLEKNCKQSHRRSYPNSIRP